MTESNGGMSGPTAATAAAMAQGWSYALNTVARPAAEHLEAAQAALTALERLDQVGAWVDSRTALSEALAAARARLQPRDVTIADLVAAVVQLRALGLVPAGTPDQGIPVPPEPGAGAGYPQAYAECDRTRAQLRARVSELEEELEDLHDNAERDAAELRRVGQLRDRFEQEARDLRSKSAVTNAGRHAEREAAMATARRREHLAILALLGTSGPGFDQMSPEELAETVGTAVRRVAKESAAVPRMVDLLTRTWRRLVDVQNGPATMRPDDPEHLADAVWSEARRVCETLGGVRRGLADQLGEIAELRAALGRGESADAVLTERDALQRSVNAQAEELRTLRAQVAALSRSAVIVLEARADLGDRAGTMHQLGPVSLAEELAVFAADDGT